jgi:hypothetical protein
LALIVIVPAVFNTLLSVPSAARSCTEGVFASRIVAIEGRQLQPLLGQPVSELRLWVPEAGKKRPIPFQIDACGPDGRLLLSASGKRLWDRLLEEQSVLLFVARDAGSRVRQLVSTDVVEIEIAWPSDDQRRWAYLGLAGGPFALSQRDDVAYDPHSDTVSGNRYTVRFQDGYTNFFSLATGTGAGGVNLIDRWKIRVEARLLWGLLKFRRNEEHITEELVAYSDGPIRVIRRSRLRTKVGWGISTPEAIVDEYFYGDHYGGPSYVRIPFKLARLFGDVDVRIYLDGRDLDGFTVTAGDHNSARTVGAPSHEAPSAPGPGVSWFMLTSNHLGFLHRLRLGPTLAGVKSDLFYVDDETDADPPEAVGGLQPGVGYRLTNWASVERGRHEIWTETYVIDPAKFRKPSAALARLSAPLHVEVHRVSSPPAGGRKVRGSGMEQR